MPPPPRSMASNPVLPKHEELAPLPISPYAVTKLAGEGYARSFHEVYGLETVTLRYFNVFGPRQDPTSQYAAAIPNFISAFLADEPPRVFGDGNQTRDFTPVENVVEANLRAIESPRGDGRVYNIACGEQISVNRVLDELRGLTGKDIQATHEETLPGQVRDSVADLSRSMDELGYRPLVLFEAGLERTLEYFRESGSVVSSPNPGLWAHTRARRKPSSQPASAARAQVSVGRAHPPRSSARRAGRSTRSESPPENHSMLSERQSSANSEPSGTAKPRF